MERRIYEYSPRAGYTPPAAMGEYRKFSQRVGQPQHDFVDKTYKDPWPNSSYELAERARIYAAEHDGVSLLDAMHKLLAHDADLRARYVDGSVRTAPKDNASFPVHRAAERYQQVHGCGYLEAVKSGQLDDKTWREHHDTTTNEDAPVDSASPLARLANLVTVIPKDSVTGELDVAAILDSLRSSPTVVKASAAERLEILARQMIRSESWSESDFQGDTAEMMTAAMETARRRYPGLASAERTGRPSLESLVFALPQFFAD